MPWTEQLPNSGWPPDLPPPRLPRDDEEDLLGPPSRLRSDAPASTQATDETPPPGAGVRYEGDMGAPVLNTAPSTATYPNEQPAPTLPTTAATSPTPFDAPELAGYRQKQAELKQYQQAHATQDPTTGEWKAKPISRIRAIGLAALRGLAQGPGGAIGGALVGLASPGRVAQSQYERGLGKLRMESADDLERARAEAGVRATESNIEMQQRPDAGGVLSIYGEGDEQPRLATRNKHTGAVEWLPAPGGGPAYGAVKPQKTSTAKTGLLDNAIETTDADGNAVYRDKTSGKIIMDPDDPTGKTPLYKSRVKTSDDETTARLNAERAAKAQAAASEAKQHGDNFNAAKAREQMARQTEATIRANVQDKQYKDNPEQWKKDVAEAHAEAEKYNQQAEGYNQKRIEAETRAQENSKPLPPDGPPKYGGGRVPSWPKGAANAAEADEMLKRAAARNIILQDSQGQPIPNPYAPRR